MDNRWMLAAMSLYLLGTALWSIRTGETVMIYRSVRRDDDPTGFWVSLSIYALLGAGILIGLLIKRE